MNIHRLNRMTPGHFFAHIPGALGYYPEDSIVLLGLRRADNRLLLGPMARFDVAAVRHSLDEAFDAVASNTDMVFAFVVTARSEEECADLSEFLFDFADFDERGIDSCWHVSELSVRQPYRQWFGPDEPLICTPQEWLSGTLPEFMAAPSMQDWVDAGELPAESREALIGPLRTTNPHIGREDAETVERIALAVAMDVIAWLLDGEGPDWVGNLAHTLLDDVERVIADIDPGADVRRDEESLSAAALWLSVPMLRDVVIEPLLKRPAAAAALMLATAQTFGGEVRSNALVLYAAALIASDKSMLASPVLNVASEDNPEHSLTHLIQRAYRGGLVDRIVGNLTHGSSLARAQWRRRLDAADLRTARPARAGGEDGSDDAGESPAVKEAGETRSRRVA